MSANDHGVASRVVESDAPAAALSPGAGHAATFASTEVAVVNSVVVAACTGLVVVAAGVHSFAIPVAAGALVGAGGFALHERHHRRARDSYSTNSVDQAAILIPPPQQADTA